MELNRYTIHYQHRHEKFYLIPLGDIHLGSKNCDKSHLQKIIDYIKDTPNTYFIGMGDWGEFINIGDKRLDLDNIDPDYRDVLARMPQALVEDLTELFLPIRDKCIGIHMGNHEFCIKKFQIDITYELCKNLGVKNLGYSAFTRLSFVRCASENTRGDITSYDVFSTHSNVAGRKGGSKLNRLEDMSQYYDADIILIAHGHRKVTTSIVQLGLSGGGYPALVQRKKVAGMTGSFYRTYQQGTASYAERAGYQPSDIGVIKVILQPDLGDGINGKQLHISE